MQFYQRTDIQIECARKLPWKFIRETVTNPMWKLCKPRLKLMKRFKLYGCIRLFHYVISDKSDVM